MSVTTTELLGPLTTLFTPPTACLATATWNPSAIWAPDYSKKLSPAVLYGATGQAPDLVCYPPAFTVNHVYSPGLCPSGWTSACALTAAGSQSGPVFPSPTIGVQCCPSNFQCSETDWCAQQPTPTSVPVWSIYTDKWGIEGEMTMSAFPNMKAMAKPIFVAYEASDKELLASATLSSTTTSSGSSKDNHKSAPTPTAAPGNSLSGGTIAGIAVGSAAGGILAALLFFFAMRFCLGLQVTRKKSGGSLNSESHHELAAKEASMARQHDLQPKSGLYNGWSATEVPSTRELPPEMAPSATEGRSELAGTRETKY